MNLLVKEFEDWLINSNRKALSNSSAYKYARAINTISSDMIIEGVIATNLYSHSSLQEIKRDIVLIKNNQFFIRKNQTGHNMYSVALDHFINFLEERN